MYSRELNRTEGDPNGIHEADMEDNVMETPHTGH